jgi:opacity protein-like surface antigen
MMKLHPNRILPAAAMLCAALFAGSARAQEKDGPLELSWLAAGQYVLVQGDRRKLLEDEGTLMTSGFLLDHFRFSQRFANGLVLDLAAGLIIPERPSWSELYVLTRFGQPGLWRIWTDVSRALSFADDSIGSAGSASGLYPSHALGRDLWKSRHDLLAGLSLMPGTGSRIDLVLDFSSAIGHAVPLKGSAYVVPASGYVFEYPALWDVGRRRGGVHLDLLWSKGGLALSFAGAYRFLSVDDALTAWRPLDGTAFDGTDVYARRRVIHTVSAGLGAELQIARSFAIAAGYQVVYAFSNPKAVQDAFGTASRVEYGGGGHSVFSHKVPLGFLVRPARGLDLRLRFLGAYSYGKTEREASGFVGDPGTVVSESQLASGVESKKFTESFELAWTGVRWLDVKLQQRFELDDRDLFRVLYDVYEADGTDLTMAEDVALKTLRLRVASLVKFKIVKGLVLDARVRYLQSWQEDVVEYLRDWTPHGDSRMWNVDARLRLRYRLASFLSLWASGRFFTGARWRPDVTDLDAGYDAQVMGFTVSGGVRAAPAPWLTLYASYSFTKGDHEVGPAPLMDAWESIGYSGRIHAAQAGFGLVPLSWFELTGGYQLVLVDGTIEHRIHRMGAEARFRVWKGLHLGVGYLGRIYDDEQLGDDGYSAHALRALVAGSF